jgi:hypothetical protein
MWKTCKIPASHRFACFMITSTVLNLTVPVFATPTTGVEPIGRIEYLAGDVELLRDGTVYDGYSLNPGDPLFAMDLIQTGIDGFVEIHLSVAGQAAIVIRESTAYYVEPHQRADGAGDVRLKLLSGSLEIAVNQLSRNSSITVETRTAALGVRGTTFDVITAPDESTLTGVRSGHVEITAGGGSVQAERNTVVEVLSDQSPRSWTVPAGEFDQFYQQWTNTRLQVFRSGASTFVRAYAQRFREIEPDFRSAYRDLVMFRDRLKRAAEASGGSLGSDMRLRTEVSPAIIRIRSVLPLFENTLYRLRELQRFHDQGIGETQIGDQHSTEFFRDFVSRERQLTAHLSEVRTLLRLYTVIEQRSMGGLSDDRFRPFGGGSPIDSMRF